AVERQIALMHAAIRDVRDLKRFIAESLDSLPDAALVTDLDGIVLIANEAARALVGDRLALAIEGLPIAAVLDALHGGDPALAAEVRALTSIIAGGFLPPQQTREWSLPDGRVLDVRLAFFSDDARRPLGWIVRLADITGLRETERQREEALRLLTHDMRSPQASILALLQSEGDGLPQELRERIARYAGQTLELAEQYVQFARVGNARPAMEPLDLSEVLLDAVDDLYPLARARAISVRTTVPDEEALVKGDRALITRAVQNILGNALKYSPDGTQVDAAVKLADGQVQLAIRDEGRGISPEDLPSVFEPFRRLAPPDGLPGEPGAGLGLAFVKRVVERHGGEVFATSRPGAGSTFGFTLPRVGA
ncbi:MAG: HAMP domain-containing sensor histidine kinase, partial [Sphingomonadaceae bacterium]